MARRATGVGRYNLGWMIGAADRRLYEFSFWLFYYAFFGLAPLVQLKTGFSSTTPGITWANANITLRALIGASAVVFYLGGCARRLTFGAQLVQRWTLGWPSSCRGTYSS